MPEEDANNLEEIAEELSEEELAELEAERLNAEENDKIKEEFENYVEMDADAESKKIHEKVMGKKIKRAVSFRFCLV